MRRLKIFLHRKIKPGITKAISIKLALILLLECAWPSATYALTGGPSQPEVQSFEPVGVSDMVDLFTGDFSYNIPLFEVDGYPMNISYHSGIGIDQEASWVGLGWNINPGVINRAMRGIPDEFNGDLVTKEQNVKKNQTVGISAALSGELFGYDNASFTARLGIKYNNYTGVGVERSFNVALSASNKYGSSGSISLGITSSSDDGLSLAPSISLSQGTSKTEKKDKVGVSIGASFNSRGGLTALTIAPEVSQGFGTDNSALRGASSIGFASAKFDFGQQTYSPNLDFPMGNLSVTANFKLGLEAWGFAGSIAPGGYYAEQGLITNKISSPAYGYMNAHNAQYNKQAMMDFNREKDGNFTPSTYNLPLTNFTYDLFSVSGQGTGGSYRPFRSDVGHVFDVESYSTSDGYTGGLELGGGGIFKGGVDFSKNGAYSHSGDWSSSLAADSMAFQPAGSNVDYEPWYFKEANERSVNSDPGFLARYGGTNAVRFELDGTTEFDTRTTGKIKGASGLLDIGPSRRRNARDKRNQTITTLTNKEVREGMGLFPGITNTYINSRSDLDHHIGQITSLSTDGRRYVYALPVYNKEQQEVSFAVGKPVGGGSGRPAANGEVLYKPGQDNSISNKMGLDNYYSNTKMPPFAHSYMLSAVLSSDYVDVTGDGPSDDDLGNYVLFKYLEKTPNYKWRTPAKKNKAKYNEGLAADKNDDKGSYVYGVKQLYYLDKIVTKNQEAEFVTSARTDGKGVVNENGDISTTSIQYKLDRILLKAKATGKVIKTVNFVYETAAQKILCANSDNAIAGKLTLKQLYFTYQNSEKGAYNSYDFSYYSNPAAPDYNENPDYNPQKYDRWGNYKRANPSVSGNPQVPFDYFPYTNQYQAQADRDVDASVWNLRQIKLPSGGKINIEYESDDYAYVQNKQATQMYLYDPGTAITSNPTTLGPNSIFYFQIPPGTSSNIRIEDFLPENGMVFFKYKVFLDQNGPTYDYIPGYAQVDMNPLKTKINFVAGNPVSGQIAFVAANTHDNPGAPGNVQIHPVTKAALQFGRLNVSRLIWDQPNASADISSQAVNALINSSFFNTIPQAVQGPNKYLHVTKHKAEKVDLTNCWLKLKNVTGRKFGGGSRVKRIILNDDFSNMVSGEEDSQYGQVYTYTTTDSKNRTISSGVATYEPQIGGEENALKEPFFTETEKLLAPDEDHYAEAPFGESFFPSATVGYSKVKVENYYPDLPNQWAGNTFESKKTGFIVHEFYTAKDFPTITERTEMEAIEHKSDPFSLASLFNIDTKDYMTTSQGFYVELNDMHGKAKSVKTYNQQKQLINSMEYFYRSQPVGKTGSRRLINKVSMIAPNGGLISGEVGVFFDMIGDLREQSTESSGFVLNINTDVIYIVVPIPTIVPIPSFSSDKTLFRSAAITKVVQRFGILEKTVAKQDGSTVTSADLAYDSESGEVLLTQTINGYNDPVYNFKYPAYWYYQGMGPAYRNIDYTRLINLTAGEATLPKGTNLYAAGDEVEIWTPPAGTPPTSSYYKAWITKSKGDKIEIKDKDGNLFPSGSGSFYVKVIRSGRRNMQTMEMANITTMVNPISGLKNNIYQKVISAKAFEYANEWDVNCECVVGEIGAKNPYVMGILGNWRQKRTFDHVSPRSQTNANNNSNLRFDGFYSAYSPFYKNRGGRWVIDYQKWIATNEVSAFSPEGQELENKDALGRYSSASYEFNQSLATAVTMNSQYKEQGYQGFEDTYTNCSPDKHFEWSMEGPAGPHTPKVETNGSVRYMDSHTGNSCLVLGFSPGNYNISPFGVKKPISTDCTKPSECTARIEFSFVSGHYEIKDGEGPFKIDILHMSGEGKVTITHDGKGFDVQPVGNSYRCMVVIVDSKGCVYNKMIMAPFVN